MQQVLDLADKSFIPFSYKCEENYCFEYQDAYNRAFALIPVGVELKTARVIKFMKPDPYLAEYCVPEIAEVKVYEDKAYQYMLITDRTLERTTNQGKVIVAKDSEKGLYDVLFDTEVMLKTQVELLFNKEFGFSDEFEKVGKVIRWKNEVISFVTSYGIRWDGAEKRYKIMKVDDIETLVGYMQKGDEIRAEVHAGYYLLLIERELKKRYKETK